MARDYNRNGKGEKTRFPELIGTPLCMRAGKLGRLPLGIRGKMTP
jgi:hypothetical protein